MNRPRLLIADDHPLLRNVVGEMLAPAYEIVALVEDGQAAIEATAQHRPDLALLDISMPVVNGLQAARYMRGHWPEVRIIFLTQQTDPAYLEEAFRLGAQGYVWKRKAGSELLLAVQRVLAGGLYHSPSLQYAS